MRNGLRSVYKPAGAVLSNIQADIPIIEALEIGTELLGGRFFRKNELYGDELVTSGKSVQKS